MTSTSGVPSTLRTIVEMSISEPGMGAAKFGAPTSCPEASSCPEVSSGDDVLASDAGSASSRERQFLACQRATCS
jgi:hypothetical protein